MKSKSREELQQLLSKCHAELDQTIDRMKSLRARLKNMIEEMTEDILANVEVLKEIEAFDCEPKPKEPDALEVYKAKFDQKLDALLEQRVPSLDDLIEKVGG